MKRLWYAFRCRVLSDHRWREIWVDEEKAFECRDCRKRHFGDRPPDDEETLIKSLGGGGG